jgi:hypothetical protein
MLGLGGSPVLADALGSGLRLEDEDGLYAGERDLKLPQRRDQACLLKLSGVVIAIAGTGVDPRRWQQPELVVEPKRVRRQAGPPGELSDAHQIHVAHFLACPGSRPVRPLCGFAQGEGQGRQMR